MDRPATLANSPLEGIRGETPNLDQSIRDHKGSCIQVTLKYFKNIPAIRGIQQISRPSNRTYINVKRILKYSIEQN